MTIRERVLRLRGQLGATGMLALAFIAGAAWVHFDQVDPLEKRKAQLIQQLELRNPITPTKPVLQAAMPSAQMAAFYQFFDRAESAIDWLANLHALAKAVGIELQSGDYRLSSGAGRLDRYQIVLPARGTSAQIRAFADNALTSIPVLSLDQVTFRRKRVSEPVVEADITFSLYLLRK